MVVACQKRIALGGAACYRKTTGCQSKRPYTAAINKAFFTPLCFQLQYRKYAYTH